MNEDGEGDAAQGATLEQEPAEGWRLVLYVAGNTPRTARAVHNMERLRATHLPDTTVEVIDLLEHPERAAEAQILAVPTLVRHAPGPMRKILGDLSRPEEVLVALGLGDDA